MQTMKMMKGWALICAAGFLSVLPLVSQSVSASSVLVQDRIDVQAEPIPPTDIQDHRQLQRAQDRHGRVRSDRARRALDRRYDNYRERRNDYRRSFRARSGSYDGQGSRVRYGRNGARVYNGHSRFRTYRGGFRYGFLGTGSRFYNPVHLARFGFYPTPFSYFGFGYGWGLGGRFNYWNGWGPSGINYYGGGVPIGAAGGGLVFGGNNFGNSLGGYNDGYGQGYEDGFYDAATGRYTVVRPFGYPPFYGYAFPYARTTYYGGTPSRIAGTLAGATVGAVIGGAIDDVSGGDGAVGAVVGALVGGALGNASVSEAERERLRVLEARRARQERRQAAAQSGALDAVQVKRCLAFRYTTSGYVCKEYESATRQPVAATAVNMID